MIALVIAVFSASVLGSLHCAGMCGAFVAFAVGLDDRTDARRKVLLQASYNTGRLATYLVLGLVAGSIGSVFDAAGQLAGVSRAAVLIAGSCMMIFGIAAILRLNGVALPRAPVPAVMRTAAERAVRFAVQRPPVVRALVTGLSTTLLPCGWLYAFVITAAGTGSALAGALVMLVFWLGTLPALVAIGTGVQTIVARLPGLGRRLPVITATLVVAVGLWNVLDRGRLAGALHTAPAPSGALVEHVKHLNDAPATCCTHDNAQ